MPLFLSGSSQGGLYYSGEKIAELPSQWSGFLLDQRALRIGALKPPAGRPGSPLRLKYEEAAKTLEAIARKRPLTADESADLGALQIRLGETGQALATLKHAEREHPRHFRIVSNLGTAWQLYGDLAQAASYLQEAARLAPGKLQKAEELQLKLVRLRLRQPAGSQGLDPLFDIRLVGESGHYEPGKLAASERKKLPTDAVARLQQVALWLPADGRLLWQLAELAAVHGDVRTAAAMLDGCVTEFGLRDPELRQHRQQLRAAAEALAAAKPLPGPGSSGHDAHAGLLRPRSKRPLITSLDAADLPPINPAGVTPLPWAVLAETTISRDYKPTFASYLHDLEGKQVSLSGYMQPLSEDGENISFLLIEYPVGCWYCEMPPISSIVLVELPPGKRMTYSRRLIKVTGELKLNSSDPERFFYTLRGAQIGEAE
jgi:tetratricopeptide (TPR) repeat protein